MGRGKHLTAEEKERIDSLHECGCSFNKIAKMLQRSSSAIKHHIRNRNEPKVERRGGCRRGVALSQSQIEAVLHIMNTSCKSCAEVKSELNIAASAETIRATIHRCSDFDFNRKRRRSQVDDEGSRLTAKRSKS